MDLFSQKSQCCGCMACVDRCFQKAISIFKDKEGFEYPKINEKLCIDCKACQSVCPFHLPLEKKEPTHYFAIQAKDSTLRENSSSGGFFPVIASLILQEGGIVYGAGLNEKMQVKHMRITNLEKLNQITKTKYVQSQMQGIFPLVKQDLKQGKPVLFVGTPCQAEALQRFLKRKYDNLILMDLICYGVASPGIWEDYVDFLEKKHRGKMNQFYFRDKRKKDNGHTVSYQIDGQEYTQSFTQNFFTALYSSSCILRPSCYACPFTSIKRNSDFTIGDFWGIEKVFSTFDDGMGTSLVLMRLEKENALWQKLQEKLHWMECTKKEALQPRLLSPTFYPKKRKLIFAGYFSFKKIGQLNQKLAFKNSSSKKKG